MSKALIIVFSYHHGNTEKIAGAMAEALMADVMQPKDIIIETLDNYSLIGFGAGIDSGNHYPELIEFAKTLPQVEGKNCFIFSTSGVYSKKSNERNHKALRQILTEKGYNILDEFGCAAFNTNSILKHFGGMNKSHPDATDFDAARAFARSLINK